MHQGVKGLILETAHPVKFSESVERITGQVVEVPASILELKKRKKQSTVIKPDFQELKQFLLERVMAV